MASRTLYVIFIHLLINVSIVQFYEMVKLTASEVWLANSKTYLQTTRQMLVLAAGMLIRHVTLTP